MDSLHPNRFSDELKMAWLSDLDRQLHDELFSRFEQAPEPPQSYRELSRELLIPEPYGRDIYSFYLQSCMDRENGEMGRYNQSAGLFNSALDDYRRHCLRNLKPKSQGPFRLKGETPCPFCPF